MANAKLPIYYIARRVPMNRAEMRAEFGPRCRAYFRGCPVCKGWRQWDKNGAADVLVGRRDLLRRWLP